jgi:hypothetical protein
VFASNTITPQTSPNGKGNLSSAGALIGFRFKLRAEAGASGLVFYFQSPSSCSGRFQEEHQHGFAIKTGSLRDVKKTIAEQILIIRLADRG